MSFFEKPPSTQWAALRFRGEKFAEVWFKPEGEPCAVTFRILQKSFHLSGMAHHLTPQNLLKAVNIAPTEVESWRYGDGSLGGQNVTELDLGSPLLPPASAVDCVEFCVRVKPPFQADAETASVAEAASNNPDIPLKEWQDLELRWKAILGLEAAIDTSRISMEGLQNEMETSLTKTLTIEEKTHALRSDVSQWTQAKNRVRFALPKLKDFIHRAVWALGSPDRKRLEEIYKDHILPRIPFPQIDKVLPQLESLQKDRQILSGQGLAVGQECRNLATSVQAAFRTLQSNAVNAQKKAGSGGKGKFFKGIRKISGADG